MFMTNRELPIIAAIEKKTNQRFTLAVDCLPLMMSKIYGPKNRIYTLITAALNLDGNLSSISLTVDKFEPKNIVNRIKKLKRPIFVGQIEYRIPYTDIDDAICGNYEEFEKYEDVFKSTTELFRGSYRYE